MLVVDGVVWIVLPILRSQVLMLGLEVPVHQGRAMYPPMLLVARTVRSAQPKSRPGDAQVP